ncbi:MAG: hypothetical protein HZY76_09635 [Anaerolineae bacterium]|nr:MAG: hypothetical protein HZY76_09635 [Anaerolineae bacterium]
MNEQEAAAWEIHEFFQSLGLPHAVIGGLENFIPGGSAHGHVCSITGSIS